MENNDFFFLYKYFEGELIQGLEQNLTRFSTKWNWNLEGSHIELSQ